MFDKLNDTIVQLSHLPLAADREAVLQPLVDYIREKRTKQEKVRLVFVCTHNSRRSHLAQVWAQAMAAYFGVQQVECYSGGTEVTAVFPQVTETLKLQGFECLMLSTASNPVYALKYAENEPAVICFSKVYSDAFNPQRAFAAIMTCSSADEGCPVVFGAEARFAVRYDDPKASDGTEQMEEKYKERSLQIAREMYYVFSKAAANV